MTTANRSVVAAPLDPRTVPALMAGGIWLPGVGYTEIGGGSHRWASQSNNTGDDYDFEDSHDGFKPVLTTAANGAAVFDLPAGGPTASFCIDDGASPRPPGAAIQFASRGAYAGWFKTNALDTAQHMFFAMWPGGGTGNRVLLHKNTDNYRLAWYVSRDGSAADEVAPAIGHRSKGNTGFGPGDGPEIDWTQWHFVRLQWVASGSNYLISGGPYSDKVLLYVDEVLIAGGAANGGPDSVGIYSAPQLGAGGDPPDGPVRGIWNAATRFSLGADFVGAQWNGQIGSFYCANEDSAAEITAAQWAGVMAFNAPGD